MKVLLPLFVGYFGSAVATQVAVLTTFDAVQPNECTDDEFNMALRTIKTRQLRSRELQLWYCSWVCRDFPKGWCKLVYPACIRYRRMEEQEEQIPPYPSSSVSISPPNERQLDRDLVEECQQKMAEVDAAFDNAVANMTDVLSTKCINTLSAPRHHVCLDLLSSNPNEQVASLAVIDAKFAKVQVTNNVFFGTGCSNKAQSQIAGESETDITYCFRVCNKGDTFLNQFLVKSDSLKFEDGSIGRLAPQACRTLSVPSTIGSKDSRTKVTATANPCDQNGNTLSRSKPVNSNAESTVRVSKLKAQFKFSAGVYVSGTNTCGAAAVKSTSVSVKANTMITYCFLIENTGTLPMYPVISDADKNFELKLDEIMQLGQISFVSREVPVSNSMKLTFATTAYPAIDGEIRFDVQPRVETAKIEVKV